MNVNPLDLQVLFSKAADHAANLGKEAASQEAVQFIATEQASKLSRISPEIVQPTTDPEEEFNKTNPDKEEREKGNRNKQAENKKENSEQENHSEPHRGMLSEDKGKHIDIID